MPGGTSKTLPEVIRKAVAKGSADLRVGVPAVVTRVDLTKGIVDAKPSLKDFFDDGDEVQKISVPVITNVPIHFPGAGAFRFTFPVAVGDECFLLFSDRSLDVWLARGGEVDPIDPRRHALSDAVALFGIHSIPKAWKNASASFATIGHDGSGPRVELDATEVRLDGGTQSVARKGDAVKKATSMGAWMTAVTAQLNASGNVAGANGALQAPTDFGVVDGGAARVKA